MEVYRRAMAEQGDTAHPALTARPIIGENQGEEGTHTTHTHDTHRRSADISARAESALSAESFLAEVQRIFDAEVVEVLPRAEGDRAGPATSLPWRYPWPPAVAGLGRLRVDTFELCSDCLCGTWARYGTTPLCYACASQRARRGVTT